VKQEANPEEVAELTKLLMQLKRCHTIRFSGSDKFFSLW
jgi:hypothetical protein